MTEDEKKILTAFRPPLDGVVFCRSPEPVPYPLALSTMEHYHQAVRQGKSPELVWFLEHPPLYTAGSTARPEELLQPGRYPVYAAGRGGKYTYHGPGQRVVYIVLALRRHRGDLRRFVACLQAWMLAALRDKGVEEARLHPDHIGVWVRQQATYFKLGAVGLRIRGGISLHGVSLNVAPDLAAYEGIVPCGIDPLEARVSSVAALFSNFSPEKRLPVSFLDEALCERAPIILGDALSAR